MHFKDSIVIAAPSDHVWEYIGSPDVWSLFHAKLVSCERTSVQGGRIHSTYAMVFRMGTRTMPTHCEIIDLRPGAMIQVQSTTADSSRPAASAELTYSLLDIGRSTRVDERVKIVVPKMSCLLRAVVWLTSRFGSPQGETTLMKLKKLVEEQ
jgi:hypothetical protein